HLLQKSSRRVGLVLPEQDLRLVTHAPAGARVIERDVGARLRGVAELREHLAARPELAVLRVLLTGRVAVTRRLLEQPRIAQDVRLGEVRVSVVGPAAQELPGARVRLREPSSLGL